MGGSEAQIAALEPSPCYHRSTNIAWSIAKQLNQRQAVAGRTCSCDCCETAAAQEEPGLLRQVLEWLEVWNAGFHEDCLTRGGGVQLLNVGPQHHFLHNMARKE